MTLANYRFVLADNFKIYLPSFLANRCPDKLESVRLFPGSINEENPSLPGRILQAADPAENDRTPRSDIILFSEL